MLSNAIHPPKISSLIVHIWHLSIEVHIFFFKNYSYVLKHDNSYNENAFKYGYLYRVLDNVDFSIIHFLRYFQDDINKKFEYSIFNKIRKQQ